MHTYYVTFILCLPDLFDLTHYIWCLGIATNPILEGDALLEATLVDEHGWGPANSEEEPEDGMLVPGA